MCVQITGSSPIGRDLNLRDARALARRTQGSEAIVKQSNGDYSVVPLNPQDLNKAKNIESANFSPSNIEFMIEGDSGNNNVVINPNASFFNRKKSEGLNGLEIAQDVGSGIVARVDGAVDNLLNRSGRVATNGDKARANVMDKINVLFENLTDKNNSYVFGGRTNLNTNTGVSNVDCSGLVNQIFKQAGITIPDMTTEGLDAYIRDGKGVLRENTNAGTIKPGDVINYPPRGNPNGGHVMIAASEPRRVLTPPGYMVTVFDSSPDGSGTRRAANGAELGSSGAGYREIFLATDKNGRVTGLNTMGDTRGTLKNNVRIGTIKDDVQLNR